MTALLPGLPASLKYNPFFAFSEKSNFVPAWHKIKPEHVLPAFEYVLRHANRKMATVKLNQEKPTFKNTIEAFEEAYELPFYFLRVLFNMMPEDEKEAKAFEKLQQKIILGLFSDLGPIFRNQLFYERLKAVDTTNDTQENKIFHRAFLNGFKDGGAKLNAEERAEYEQLELRSLLLEMKSNKTIKSAREKTLLIVNKKEDLAGLSPSDIQTAADKASKAGHKGKWVFTTERDIYDSFMQSAHNRDLRRKLYELHNSIGAKKPYDNQNVIHELIKIRRQLARLLGYSSAEARVVEYLTEDKVRNVRKFLQGLQKVVIPTARKESQILSGVAMIQDNITTLEPWDIDYYQERLKEQVIGFSEESLRPYFELENVLKGTLNHFEKQLGLRFTQTKKYPLPHPDVRTYDVHDKRSGNFMGVLCMDLFERKGKHPFVAWNTSILPQGLFMGKVRRPVEVIAMKIAKGAEGQPTLCSHTQVVVKFHEIGHAVHNLCSMCRHSSMSGTNVRTDFVEFPSQFQENWAYEPAVIKTMAIHYKTGERLSDEIMEKIRDSRKFMAGLEVMKLLKKSWLDLAWHTADPESIKSVRAFETKALKDFSRIPARGEYLSPSLVHIFGGGYNSSLQSYLYGAFWEAAAFEPFKRKGLYDKQKCADYRELLAAGDTVHPKLLFQKFHHRAASHTPYLRRHGFAGNSFNYMAGLMATMEQQEAEATAQPQIAASPAIA